MKKISRIGFSILFIACGLTLLIGCNFPTKSTPTLVFPTPNRTLTALFDPLRLSATPVVPSATVPPLPTVPVHTATSISPTLTPVVNTATVPPAATNTAGATATRVPPTSTLANRRSGTSISAQFLNVAPTIDGSWEEWNTKQYPVKAVVYGAGNRTGDEDLEASFRIGWDNTYLYIAVKVNDDKYVQNATGADIFKGDSVEILLDTDLLGDFNDRSLSSDDYQLGLSPGKGGTSEAKEAYLWYPRSKAGSLSNVVIGAEGGDGVWRLEARIPWSVFGINPAEGKRFGFALSVSDNDNPDSNVQQSMVSNVAGRVLTDPTTWGELILNR